MADKRVVVAAARINGSSKYQADPALKAKASASHKPVKR